MGHLNAVLGLSCPMSSTPVPASLLTPAQHHTHLSDPVGHDVGAGGAEMEVEDHNADHNHGCHQKHDKKQIPAWDTDLELALPQRLGTGGVAFWHCGDLVMFPLHLVVPRTHLPMRGMAWEVAGRRWEMSRRKTDWARSTEITRVIFSPPGQQVSSGQTLPKVPVPALPVPGLQTVPPCSAP